MTLTDGTIGGVYLMTGMELQESVTRRLQALGMNGKTKLTILEKKPKGAMIIRLRGTRLALGRRITDGILVEPEQDGNAGSFSGMRRTGQKAAKRYLSEVQKQSPRKAGRADKESSWESREAYSVPQISLKVSRLHKNRTAVLAGNPNCGKTTLFNALTGASLKTGNWPGVTVERMEGMAEIRGQRVRIIDLPGIYSLTSYSMEERVSRDCIMDGEADVIINVADASSLERSLYLTLRLLELGKPVVLALNMMDLIEERGIRIDLERLSGYLGGIPVIPVSARMRTGLEELLLEAVTWEQTGQSGGGIRYSTGLERKIEAVQRELESRYGRFPNSRWIAVKELEADEEILRKYPLPRWGAPGQSLEAQIIQETYDYIEEMMEACMENREGKAAWTDAADRLLTHPIWGIPAFFLILAAVFFLTFTVGDFLKGYFELGLEGISGLAGHGLEAVGAAEWLKSLVTDGIIAGVGGILTFLPNLFILFLALAVLEDSGYMARAAYVMDGIMGSVGLSGKAFLPMVLGFGCTVPAVLASRTLESEEDRKRTIFITPFMSCSARLPIYVLFSGLFFGKYAMAAAYSFYVIGVLAAIVIARIINRVRPKALEHALLIELPDYRRPDAGTIAVSVWEKVKDYLTKAGTTIFVSSIVLWFLLNFGVHGMVSRVSESFGAAIGHALVPVLAPAGLGFWQMAVALISGLTAKEMVVSSCSVLFGIGSLNSPEGMTALHGILGAMGFGPLNAYCFMLFCLLYSPCAAAVAAIKRETRSWSWTIKMAGFQLLAAWSATAAVYQIGRLL